MTNQNDARPRSEHERIIDEASHFIARVQLSDGVRVHQEFRSQAVALQFGQFWADKHQRPVMIYAVDKDGQSTTCGSATPAPPAEKYLA